ncbi:MAG TPA: hypothetical protein DEV81_23520 [Cyanobacteria bacterium UBA11049]|nr:hypothetical protein [Cyanobacteria bacterium UBA11049]
MSSQNSSNLEPNNKVSSTSLAATPRQLGGVDIEQELNRLEEMVLSSPHIPLTRRTIVDEEQLLDQLDLIRLHLPTVLQEAQAIAAQKQMILLQAQQQAEEIIQASLAQAAQMISEMTIVQQAELEAKKILQQAQQDCITAQEENEVEIDLIRQQTQQELNQMRQKAIAEAQAIQNGADAYADAVLGDIEQQLKDMLRVIHNGRQQLKPNVPAKGIPFDSNSGFSSSK